MRKLIVFGFSLLLTGGCVTRVPKQRAALKAETIRVYGWGFDPEPYPKIDWGGTLVDWVPGDFNWDRKVGVLDLLPFQECASGPGVYLRFQYDDGSHAACWMCDFDNDWDVDQADFAVLQRLMENAE